MNALLRMRQRFYLRFKTKNVGFGVCERRNDDSKFTVRFVPARRTLKAFFSLLTACSRRR